MFQRLERIRAVMKMYTNESQTAKLIELGLPKPKSIEEFLEPENDWSIGGLKQRKVYSIGELLLFLPKSIKVNDCYFTLIISAEFDNWLVEYVDIAYGSQAYVRDVELIDALFTEIVMLKEKGVI